LRRGEREECLSEFHIFYSDPTLGFIGKEKIEGVLMVLEG
jgi:hypothetical protein